MKVTRRRFLGFLGAASAAFSNRLWGVSSEKETIQSKEENPPKGIESWALSVCGQCQGGCGIRARIIDSNPTKFIQSDANIRAVKLDGNPLHPINRGTLCPKGQAGLQTLYNPDRIRGPLKRVGKKGEGKFEPISWEEAINIVVKELKSTRESGKSHTLAIMAGEISRLQKTLFERFLTSFGSPNYLDRSNSLEEGDYLPLEATYFMQGTKASPIYDVGNANFILSFGFNFLESFWSPVQLLRNYGEFRRGRAGVHRGRHIQIEPRLSLTAAKADQWIPINPGTEGALALGIAHVLLKEDLYDKDFVRNHTFGFEDSKNVIGEEFEGYKSLVLKEYNPPHVSNITGIPAEIIINLARSFVINKPSIAIGGRGKISDQMAIYSLNALLGNIDSPGGVLFARDLPRISWPSPTLDEIARKGLATQPLLGSGGKGPGDSLPFSGSLWASKILIGKPYKLRTLFIFQTNPLFSEPDREEILKALESVPTIVSFSSVMDETTKMADLILPDHTYLEKWNHSVSYTLKGYPVVGITKPVLNPLYNTMSTEDLIIRIAKLLGGNIAASFPYKDFEEVIRRSALDIYESRRGTIFGSPFEVALTTQLIQQGYVTPPYPTFDEFWQELLEKGGWVDPIYYHNEWGRIFHTSSKKFEFYSQLLRETLKRTEKKDDQRNFLPHHEKPDFIGEEKEYPFYLVPYKLMNFVGIKDPNQPMLIDIPSPIISEKWGSWVEINPETANRLGISDGQEVTVASSFGKLKVMAKLYSGLMPMVVSIPIGLGHQEGGRFSKASGENPIRLLAKNDDETLDCHLPFRPIKVKIYKP